jgi:HD-GYP domain-containing protein (c-di-GMP phosphodiesterase class II)
VEIKELVPIAQYIHEEALEGAALRFPEFHGTDAAQQIAAHSLAVAQVMARLIRHDTPWRAKPLDPILAALVFDVGMLKVPAAIMQQVDPLNDEQRRQIECHPLWGAELAAQLLPTTEWLIEAAGQHHERLDGTGYPGGLAELQIKPLIRLLAVCDNYAARCQPRLYRPAFDTRTALTDTLLLAEKGELDRTCAERLLLLSFYPVGTLVEFSDGAIGVVVATHQSRRDFNTPARPVVGVLTNTQGEWLPAMSHVDLADVETRSIVRALPAAERRERLGLRYPHLS